MDDFVILDNEKKLTDRIERLEKIIFNTCIKIGLTEKNDSFIINMGIDKLFLSKTQNFSTLDYSKFKYLFNLDELSISYLQSPIWEGDINFIDFNNDKLKKLYLYDFKILKTFKGLEQLHTLEKISVNYFYCNDFFQYAKILQLKSVILKKYENLIFEDISNLIYLEELYLDGYIPINFFELVKNLPLKKLILSYNTPISSIEDLSELKSLEDLTINFGKNKHFIDIILTLPKLKNLYLYEACDKFNIKNKLKNINVVFIENKI